MSTTPEANLVREDGPELDVLCIMMHSRAGYSAVREVLRRDDFSPRNGEIFDALCAVVERDVPHDIGTIQRELLDELTRRGELGRIGGGPYLHTIQARAVTNARADYYAQVVLIASIQRQLGDVGTNYHQLAKSRIDPTVPEELDALLGRARDTLALVTDRLRPRPDAADEPDAPLRLPSYDPKVYQLRPVLSWIRQHAHNRLAPADAVLISALLAVSASIPGGVTIDSGLLAPVTPGVFGTIVDTSGGGKTSSMRVARQIVRTAPPLTLSTGEGLLEAFFGTRETTELNARGKPVTKAVRCRTRGEIMFVVGEGANLYAEMDREGSKLGGILRDFWSGTDVGTTNATADRNRNLEAGTYNGGVLVGLQPSIVGRLIGDTGTGTAQRFLWCATSDPTIAPAEPLTGRLFLPPDVPLDSDGLILAPVTISVDRTIRDELTINRISQVNGTRTVGEHDTHRPVMLLKLAAVLAWIEGRLHINVEDWIVAEAILVESDKVRDAVIEAAEEQRRIDAIREGHQRAAVKSAELGRGQLMNVVTARLLRVLGDADRPLSKRDLQNKFNSKSGKKALVGDALDSLDEEGLVIRDSDGYSLSPDGRRKHGRGGPQ